MLNEGTIGEFTVARSKRIAAEVLSYRGWYMDLPSTGERMVVPNRFQGSVLIGTTRIPVSDICRPSGRGFIMHQPLHRQPLRTERSST